MSSKGFTKSETPDLLINIFTKEKEQEISLTDNEIENGIEIESKIIRELIQMHTDFMPEFL